jgi:hypothetical protein
MKNRTVPFSDWLGEKAGEWFTKTRGQYQAGIQGKLAEQIGEDPELAKEAAFQEAAVIGEKVKKEAAETAEPIIQGALEYATGKALSIIGGIRGVKGLKKASLTVEDGAGKVSNKLKNLSELGEKEKTIAKEGKVLKEVVEKESKIVEMEAVEDIRKLENLSDKIYWDAKASRWRDVSSGRFIKPTSIVTTEADEAFFWSGRTKGIGGERIAREIAEANKGVTVEKLIKQRGLKMPEWNPNQPSTIQAWESLSREYARNASGTVRAVIGESSRSGSMWKDVELPELMKNPKVEKIIAIDPLTRTERVIFTRK